MFRFWRLLPLVLPVVAEGSAEGPNFIADAVEKAVPGVVTVKTAVGGGSGFVVRQDGFVVTNAHVIEENRGWIRVTMYDGTTHEAQIVGLDTSVDIALLKLKGTSFPSIALADSSKLRLGDFAVAIGNPLNVPHTASLGIVSNCSRVLPHVGGWGASWDFIQTDAFVHVGSSGGPLVDVQGCVIGMTTLRIAESMAYAVPINRVKEAVDQFMKYGYIRKPYLGLLTKKQTSHDRKQGLQVWDVTAGSPAQKAGLQRGDILMKADHVPLYTREDLATFIGIDIAKTFTFTVFRDGSTLHLPITTCPKQ